MASFGLLRKMRSKLNVIEINMNLSSERSCAIAAKRWDYTK